MSGSAHSDFLGGALVDAMAELIGVAATIDCLYEASDRSMELLEVRRTLHNELIALGALERAREGVEATHALA